MHQKAGEMVYKFIQNWRREPISECLQELEESQWHSEEKLCHLQWERLMEMVSHAYDTVPFYQERFKKNGLHPRDIRSAEDFARIPLLTKQELRLERSQLLSSKPRENFSAMATSGSSGDPLTVIRNRLSMAYHRAAIFRGHRWFGIDVGAKEARLWGVPPEFKIRWKEQIKDKLMNRIRHSAYKLDEKSLYDFYRRLLGFKPNYLFGYTSCMYEFARFVLDEGLSADQLMLAGAVTTSETLHPFQRKAIELAFGCPAINEFGCTETGIIAYQCPSGGMHIPVEAVYVEIIPDHLDTNPDLGRVVVTDLHNYAMPIIRYDIGDLACLSDSRCPCGRALPMLENISGRASDMIVTPDGRKIHTILFYYIFCGVESDEGNIKKFQVIQQSDLSLIMRLVTDRHFQEADLKNIQKQIKSILSDNMRVKYEIVEDIPRTAAGKHRDFIHATTT